MQNHSIETFQKYMAAFHITLSKEQYEQFIHYYELLTEWNSFMNLTAITDYDEIVLKHFTDSLSLVKAFSDPDFLIKKEYSLIDVGTGAGFPAIPLRSHFRI